MDKGLKLIKQLKKQFRKDFGPACSQYYWCCYVCEGWRMLEALEDLYDFEKKIEHIIKGGRVVS